MFVQFDEMHSTHLISFFPVNSKALKIFCHAVLQYTPLYFTFVYDKYTLFRYVYMHIVWECKYVWQHIQTLCVYMRRMSNR